MNTAPQCGSPGASTVALLAQPSSPAAADPEAGNSQALERRVLRVPVVLLVEDNPINQVVAMEFLALMGLSCRLAKDGIEALNECAAGAPDLILMDIQMPGMDGLECARRLRELQRLQQLPHFPILALTAHALESDVSASLEAGMDEHLTKPLDFASLRRRLSHWLELPGVN
ncbi:response regulator [Paucibacter sp. APW11]|uniref:Response regulator n=1 Tax=Roseateles aquae TaxID=3077235 RepID=A0ABU3PDK1_9BURK|nr:response regulator [Paucibacter sp. APW11]MDT9000618.1 response regulator [Paucibacter sp. APW11]